MSGSASKHKDRIEARKHEPTPDPNFGNVPKYLSEAQKDIWRELVSEIPPRVLTKSDRKTVEIAVRMIERMRHIHNEVVCWAQFHADGTICPGEMKSSDYATLNRCLSQLGCTPADRSKIKAAPAPEKEVNDPWAEFDVEQEVDGTETTQ